MRSQDPSAFKRQEHDRQLRQLVDKNGERALAGSEATIPVSSRMLRKRSASVRFLILPSLAQFRAKSATYNF
jgi:hypothetical protein